MKDFKKYILGGTLFVLFIYSLLLNSIVIEKIFSLKLADIYVDNSVYIYIVVGIILNYILNYGYIKGLQNRKNYENTLSILLIILLITLLVGMINFYIYEGRWILILIFLGIVFFPIFVFIGSIITLVNYKICICMLNIKDKDKIIDRSISDNKNHMEQLELFDNSEDNKTLLELYKVTEDKTNFESYVVQTSEVAIRKPLKELSNEEIRLLISQKIGLKYLLPKALRILENNILTACHYYNGDLFATLLKLNEEDWKNSDIKKFISIINSSFKELEKLRDEAKDEYNIELFNNTQEFLQKYKDN